MTRPAKPNRGPDDDLSPAQLEEFEMELALAAFERDCAIEAVIDGIGAQLHESHRVCFRAGWKYARAAGRGTT